MAVSLTLDPFTNDPFFRSIFGDFGGGPAVSDDGSPMHNPHVIRTDVLEYSGKYKVIADIPGVSKDQIKVSVDGDVLRIAVDGKEVVPTGSEGNKIQRWLTSGRSPIYAPRTVRLPPAADVSKISKAKYENGVLTLEIPTKKDEGPKAIPVS